ncbi:hypothetical protein BV511_06655 [Methylorubrum extorquens]|nr:hypothetical protein BV511_06655 [Methylorubrum extorquens]
MMFWQALMRLLATLAVVSLVLAPATASVVAASPGMSAGMATPVLNPAEPADDMATMVMDDMPCCPPAKPVMPDCQKGCPLAALCQAKLAPALPAIAGAPFPVAHIQVPPWWASAAFRSLTAPPPSEPPRA